MNKVPLYAEDRLDELLEKISSILQENQRPASEVILDEPAVLNLLKVCKRSLASFRAEGLLTYYKVKGTIFYKLSDVLEMVNSHKVDQFIPSKRLLG